MKVKVDFVAGGGGAKWIKWRERTGKTNRRECEGVCPTYSVYL
jgi:NAD-dependent dihydropyrimidine dehydrogenase PreA subunit